MIITIDGPSGSGKSTLAVLLAKELGFFCLNGGYLYRGIAYVLKNFYSYDNEKLLNPNMADIQACFDSGSFRYEYLNGISYVFWGNVEITQFLKQVEITQAAAILGQNDSVRKIIVEYEHNIVKNKDVVIEGRACGSVQFPDADVKLYVTASLDIRAKREMDDLLIRGNKITQDKALENVSSRDNLDMNRKSDPLIIPRNAIILDTSNLNKAQMLKEAMSIVAMHIK